MTLMRKWETQINLSLCSRGAVLVLPTHIGRIKTSDQETIDLVNNCHIYMVLKREKISFVKDSVEIHDGKLGGKLQRVHNEITKEASFSIPISTFLFPFHSVEVSGPNSDRLVLRDEEGDEQFSGPIPLILPRSHVDQENFQDVEVIYIGQSMGRDKNRNAAERLGAHSTLQQILADTLYNDPGSEIILALIEYEDSFMHTGWNGREVAQITGERDINRIMDAREALSDKRMQVCIAEAGLISYFKPIYNSKLKSGFPTTKPKFLRQAYSLDIESITVEVNTGDLGLRIFGGGFPPGYHHIARYDLHDPTKRRGFFSLKMSDTDIVDVLGSGPLF